MRACIFNTRTPFARTVGITLLSLSDKDPASISDPRSDYRSPENQANPSPRDFYIRHPSSSRSVPLSVTWGAPEVPGGSGKHFISTL